MTSRVVLSFMYRAACIKVSGWVGTSLVVGLASTALAVLSIDTDAAYLLLKRRLDRTPKVSIRSG